MKPFWEIEFNKPEEYNQVNLNVNYSLEHKLNMNYNHLYGGRDTTPYPFEKMILVILACFDLCFIANNQKAPELKKHLKNCYEKLNISNPKISEFHPFDRIPNTFTICMSNDKNFSQSLKLATEYLLKSRNINNPTTSEIEFYNVVSIEILFAVLQTFNYDFLKKCNNTKFFDYIKKLNENFENNYYNDWLTSKKVR